MEGGQFQVMETLLMLPNDMWQAVGGDLHDLEVHSRKNTKNTGENEKKRKGNMNISTYKMQYKIHVDHKR